MEDTKYVNRENDIVASPINFYKVHVYDSTGHVTRVFVFCGGTKTEDNFDEIFSDSDERAELTERGVKPVYSNQQIHPDDSIRVIKQKILRELDESTVAYDEIYMFSYTEQPLHVLNIYQSMTKNGKHTYLTCDNVSDLLANLSINDATIDRIDPNKKKYYYEDLLALNIQNGEHGKNEPSGERDVALRSSGVAGPETVDFGTEANVSKMIIKQMIGRRFSKQHDYLFQVNPFEISPSSPLFINSVENQIVSYENQVLLNYGKIVSQNIYICLAKDVLEYVEKDMKAHREMVCPVNNIKKTTKKTMNLEADAFQTSILQNYYPLLFEQNITSLESFDPSTRQKLIKTSSHRMTKSVFDHYKTVDLFYDIYNGRKADSDLKYLERGIKSVLFTIKSEQQHTMPLELIFKNINATKITPFIKYNPGSRQENIYRLYTAGQTSRNGKKIPVLSETKIMKLSREVGKGRKISMLIQNKDTHDVAEQDSVTIAEEFVNDTDTEFIIDFDINGDITVHVKIPSPIDEVKLDDLIDKMVNPIIDKMNGFLMQGGYHLNRFNQLRDTQIEVKTMNFEAQFRTPIESNAIFQMVKGCISNVFDIDEMDVEANTATMRFKRVENFQEMESQMAFISDIYKKTQNMNDIKEGLMEKFELTYEAANLRIVDFLNKHSDNFGEVVENPGFPTTFRIDKKVDEQLLIIEIDNITSVKYLEVLQIYIDSILRASLFPKSTSITASTIKTICNRATNIKKDVDKTHIKNIIQTVEPVRRAQPIKFDSDDEDDGKGIYFMDDDEDEGEGGEEEEEDVAEGKRDEDEEDDDDGKGAIFFNDDDSPIDEENIQKDETGGAIDSPRIDEEKEPAEEGTEQADVEVEEEEDGTEQEEEDGTEQAEEDGTEQAEEEGIEQVEEAEEDLIKYKHNPAGMDLGKYFLNRMKRRDPALFLTSVRGNYSAYSTLCQANSGRQPVSLTDEEKTAIDERDATSKKNSYSRAISYHSGVSIKPGQLQKKNWYICPRYWCLLTNMSMTDTDVKEGKCVGRGEPTLNPKYKPGSKEIETQNKFIEDKIIPQKSEFGKKSEYKVPKDAFVYEFTSKSHKGEKDEKGETKYNEYYPGFLDDDQHPKKYCMPCCFKLDEENKKGCYDKYPHSKNDVPKDVDENGESLIGVSRKQCKRFRECSKKKGKAETTATDKMNDKTTSEYIHLVFSLDTYPIPQKGRWGFLPLSVQAFLQIDNAEYGTEKNSSIIKSNTPCFLRFGIEQYPEELSNQSFLGIIADIYSYKHNRPKTITVAELKETVFNEETIPLDSFIKYHNGSLATIFRPKRIGSDRWAKTLPPTLDNASPETKPAQYKELDYINVNDYAKTSEFIKQIKQNNDDQRDFAESTIASYKNFLLYLKDKTVEIDHTYLWDMFTDDNPKLIPGGINLVILEILKHDITDNIQLLCPTNSYKREMFDETKGTVIVLKHDKFPDNPESEKYYEPIYLYEKIANQKKGEKETDVEYRSTKIFFKTEGKPGNNEHIRAMKNIQRVFKIIQSTTNAQCKPLPSLPKVYKFKQNLHAEEIYIILKDTAHHNVSEKMYHFEIDWQVINYQGSVIGLGIKIIENKKVKKDKKTMFVETPTTVYLPCFPSGPIDGKTIKYMDDDEIWTDYNNTIANLNIIHAQTNLHCMPKLKILDEDDAKIVGILTETNQFIQIDPPEDNIINDGIDVISSSNYAIADKYVTSSTILPDSDRVNVTKKIHLESQFYSVFRSTMRQLLNDSTNRDKRTEIWTIVGKNKEEETDEQKGQEEGKERNNRPFTYKEKLVKIDELLQEIASDKIVFGPVDNNQIMELDEIVPCSFELVDNIDKADLPKYCIINEQSGQIVLTIPDKHLVASIINDVPTFVENKTRYFGRLADELLRYNRVQSFMLEPKTFLNITNTEYNIHSDELLILQSVLNSVYFQDLRAYNTSKYIQNTNRNVAEPSISQTYSNALITMDEQNQLVQNAPVQKSDLALCVETNRYVETTLWKPKYFPEKTNKIVFSNHKPECSFAAIIYILTKTFTDYQPNIEKLKISLWAGNPINPGEPRNDDDMGYSELIMKYPEKIVKILKKQNKQKLLESVKNYTDVESFKKMILDPKYFLTDLDIWILARQAKLPIVLFSSTTLKYLFDKDEMEEEGKTEEKTVKELSWLVLAGNIQRQPFHFIHSPVNMNSKNPIPSYQLIDKSFRFSELEPFNKIIQDNDSTYIKNTQSLSTYLQNYV
jgi:hypothetical protein